MSSSLTAATLFMSMGRDSDFEEANVRVMASELDRLLDKHKKDMEWADKLDAAQLLRNNYGSIVKALDHMVSTVIPKYPQLMRDPEIVSVAKQFLDFGDRYNVSVTPQGDFDLHSFQGASLNEFRFAVRDIIRGV